MKSLSKILLLTVVTLMLLGGCARQHSGEENLKYPRKPADNPERKAGPAMMLYEAAEDDADPNNVIVIPPSEKKKKVNK